jgi:hypothetical protein
VSCGRPAARARAGSNRLVKVDSYCTQPLWPLVSDRPLPRLHLLSDLHLDTGPYEISQGLDFDIVVAAGDVGPLDVAVPWLSALGKPVVYVHNVLNDGKIPRPRPFWVVARGEEQCRLLDAKQLYGATLGHPHSLRVRHGDLTYDDTV